MRKIAPLVAAMLALSACAVVPYDSAPEGTFTGHATVVWVGSGEPSLLGDGEFLYVPIPGRALTFTRSDDADASPGAAVIQPEAFYTDGGSIPRAVQGLPGFNAWGYGPAYIIHDWLFVARKCLNDEKDLEGEDKELVTDRMRDLSEMSFRESAVVMAELIKTLAKEGKAKDGSGEIISNVTAGPISQRLWNETGACIRNAITPEDQKIIDDITRQEQRIARQSVQRGAVAGLQSTYRTRSGVDYVVVGRYVFN